MAVPQMGAEQGPVCQCVTRCTGSSQMWPEVCQHSPRSVVMGLFSAERWFPLLSQGGKEGAVWDGHTNVQAEVV